MLRNSHDSCHAARERTRADTFRWLPRQLYACVSEQQSLGGLVKHGHFSVQSHRGKRGGCKHFGLEVCGPSRASVSFVDGGGGEDAEELHRKIQGEAPLLGRHVDLGLWEPPRERSHEHLHASTRILTHCRKACFASGQWQQHVLHGCAWLKSRCSAENKQSCKA